MVSCNGKKDQELYEKALVRVYNRRGLLVYEASGLEHEWDGKVNGQNLPADVYFYTLEVDPLNPVRNKKGTVIVNAPAGALSVTSIFRLNGGLLASPSFTAEATFKVPTKSRAGVIVFPLSV